MNASFLNSKTLSQILGAAIIPVSPLSPSFSVTHHQSADLVCHMENASPATRRRLNSPLSPRCSNGLLQSDNTAHKKELTMKLREKVPLRRPSLFQSSSPPAPSSISSTQPCQSPLLTEKTPHGGSAIQEFLRQMDTLTRNLIEEEEGNNQTKQKVELFFKPKAAPVVAKINAKFSTDLHDHIATKACSNKKLLFARYRLTRRQEEFQTIAKLPTAEVGIHDQPELEKMELQARREQKIVAKTQCENEGDEEMKKEILVELSELLSAIEELRAPFR